MYEAGVGVVLTCITKQNMQLKKRYHYSKSQCTSNRVKKKKKQVDFFAKQVPFEAHLSNRQRISPSKQWPFPANCDSCLSNGQARIQDCCGSPTQSDNYTFTSTTCKGMHYNIKLFWNSLRETEGDTYIVQSYFTPFYSHLYSKNCPYSC